jgi:hypothetical protein
LVRIIICVNVYHDYVCILWHDVLTTMFVWNSFFLGNACGSWMYCTR